MAKKKTRKNQHNNTRMSTTNKILIGVAGVVFVIGLFFLFSPTQQEERTLQPAGSIFDTNAHNHLHGIGYDAKNKELYLATHFGLFILRDDENLYWVEGTNDDYMGFSLNQKNPTIIYTSGHPAIGGNLGVMKSTNRGANWERIFTNLGAGRVDFHSMTISLADDQVLAGSFQGRIYLTQDAGETWTITAQAPPQGPCWGAPCLAADTQERTRIYAGTNTGLYVTNNLGQFWTQVSPGFFAGVAVHPENNEQLFAFSQEGVVMSQDAGRTWTTKNNGITLQGNEFVFAFTFDINNPDTIYLATTGQQIYKTSNAGETWTRIL